MIQMK